MEVQRSYFIENMMSNVFLRVCTLIFFGVHFIVYETDAKKVVEVDVDDTIREEELTDQIVKHPKGISISSSRSSQRTLFHLTPPPPIVLRMLPKGVPIPPSGPSKRHNHYPLPLPHTSSFILNKQFKMNFGMLPKGVPISLFGSSRRHNDYPPPPPHASSVILKGVPIPPPGPSQSILQSAL